jgi:hypothetical protein
MRIVAAIFSVALLVWGAPASAQKTYSLSVSQHRAVPELSEGEVNTILAEASKMLRKDSSHNSDDDVACDVAFTLEGPVRTFGSTDTPEVVDEKHIQAVHRVNSNVAGADFHVKVVKEITFCRAGLTGPFNGCSYSPPDFRSMIVIHPKLHRDAQGRPVRDFPDYLLWPHEFGHLTGLGHRHRSEGVALMTPCSLAEYANLPERRIRVNRAECNCLLSGPASCPLPPPRACQ